MKKRLFAVILTLCMCLVNVTTAFATEGSLENSEESTSVTNEVITYSGEEIWNGSGTVHVGSFTMEGNNLTPVKITGYSGPLAIITNFRSTRSNTPVYLRVEIRDWATIKSTVRENLKDYIFMKTKRNPMIIPIIMEV